MDPLGTTLLYNEADPLKKKTNKQTKKAVSMNCTEEVLSGPDGSIIDRVVAFLHHPMKRQVVKCGESSGRALLISCLRCLEATVY